MFEVTISIPAPTVEGLEKWLNEHPSEMSRTLYGLSKCAFWDMIDSGAFLIDDKELIL